MLKEIKQSLNLPENKNFTTVGLDYLVEYQTNEKGHKFRCMICLNYLGKSGVLKHLQTNQHQALFLNHCFPSVAKFLDNLACHTRDETIKLITDSFINTLTIEICREIGRLHSTDDFCPLLALRISDKEFNSKAMSNFVLNKMQHVHETNNPETKKAIDQIIKKFIVKSKQMLDEAAASGSPIKKNAIVQTNEKSPSKDQNCEKCNSKVFITHTELERMKVAINISMELVKNGLQISPLQLEESVRSYYKFELKKSLPDGELDILEKLTTDDLLLLLENYESLCEDEQEYLKKYLIMLMKIEDKTYKELIANKKCAEIVSEIIKS